MHYFSFCIKFILTKFNQLTMKIFFAFAHQDRDLVNQLITFAEIPFSKNGIEIWHERLIPAGSVVSLEIEKNLQASEIVLFFLSSDFLTTSTFSVIEPEVIRRVQKNELQLIPILLRPCLWSYADFAQLGLKILSEDQAISSLSAPKKEEAFSSIIEDIITVAKQKKNETKSSPKTDEPLRFRDENHLFSTLRELLSENKTAEVFDILDQVIQEDNSELANTVVLLKSRYNRTEADRRKGIITNENYTVETSKIFSGLLSLIEEIPREVRSRGIGESNVFLDSISKSTGFEQDQKEYERLRNIILSKERNLKEVFQQVDTLDLQNYPQLLSDYGKVQNRYQIIQNQGLTASSLTEEKLDQIREEVLDILKKFEEVKAKEQEQLTKVDVTQSDKVFLNEIKLILVGNSGVGKTTLQRNLISDGRYKVESHNSTPGLDVVTWIFNGTDNLEEVKLNIWDFGGQGKYRAIQQFFCTSRALYVYVTAPNEQDQLDDDNYTGIEYWLNFVKVFGYYAEEGQYSPIIKVMNKCDTDEDEKQAHQIINEKYGIGYDFVITSCKTGEGLEVLKTEIRKRMAETGMLRSRLSSAWLNLKNRLQKLAKVEPYILYSEFLEHYEKEIQFNAREEDEIRNIENTLLTHLEVGDQELENYFKDHEHKLFFSTIIEYAQEVKSAKNWANLVARKMKLEQNANAFVDYLSAVGIILYYPRVKSMRNKLILDPNWARKMAYKILDSPYSSTGILHEDDLAKIFPDDRNIYGIDLLLAYSLCYAQKKQDKSIYIIPCLFSNKEPLGWIDLQALQAAIQYECVFSPIIPADLHSKLISRLFLLIDGRNNFWKHGSMFSKDKGSNNPTKTYAQVKEFWKNNKITVSLIGDFWEELMTEIANEIDAICKEVNSNPDTSNIRFQENVMNLGTKEKFDLALLRDKENNKVSIEALKKRKLVAVNNKDAQVANVSIDNSEEKKAILFLSACPKGMVPLRFNKENQLITETRLSVKSLLQVEADRLRHHIKDSDATFIHFSLHGKRSGGLLFINNINEEAASEVETKEIEFIFNKIIGNKQYELVCFSACHSFKFATILAPLIKNVIGMDGAFPDDAAAQFAKELYSNLSQGDSIEVAFKSTLWGLKRMKIPPQEGIEVHAMPKLYVDNQLVEINI